MSTQTFLLPDVGEGLTEAEIVSWRVAPGDAVAVNDVLVEIETAKSLVELPSPFAGVVGDLLASEGDTVNVGAAIITIAGADASAPPATAGQSEHGEPHEPEAMAAVRCWSGTAAPDTCSRAPAQAGRTPGAGVGRGHRQAPDPQARP